MIHDINELYSGKREQSTKQPTQSRQVPVRRGDIVMDIAIATGGIGLLASAVVGISVAAMKLPTHKQKQSPSLTSEYKLPTKHVTPATQLTIGHITTKVFNAVPKYNDGDSLQIARRISITGNSCKELSGTHIARGDGLVIAANESDEAALTTPLTIGENNGGVVSICNISHTREDGFDNYPAITVAIQEQPLKRVG
jgi:hypothetical protein